MKSLTRTAFAGLSVVMMLAAISVAYGQGKVAAPKYAVVDKVIKAKCVGCHQGASPAGGVDLTSYDKVLKGKYKGKPLVVVKKAKDSVLAKALHGTGVMKMPPAGPLTPAEIKVVEAWINGGAKK